LQRHNVILIWRVKKSITHAAAPARSGVHFHSLSLPRDKVETVARFKHLFELFERKRPQAIHTEKCVAQFGAEKIEVRLWRIAVADRALFLKLKDDNWPASRERCRVPSNFLRMDSPMPMEDSLNYRLIYGSA